MNKYNIPTLSFCITCKNRFHQISKTLPVNLNDNRLYSHLIEFILVDFGSTDGLKDWVKKYHINDIESGYLKYYYTEELKFWHAPIAKNTSHYFAHNDILVNLDCDNFTGPDGGRFIIRQFLNSQDAIVLHLINSDYRNGSFGRICMNVKYFDQVGGYDESFLPMAYQDNDLIDRLISIGLKEVRLVDDRFTNAIRNTKEEGLSFSIQNMAWEDMLKHNKHISQTNISSGHFITNKSNGYGIRVLYDILGNKIEK